jgi:hypothetical protein
VQFSDGSMLVDSCSANGFRSAGGVFHQAPRRLRERQRRSGRWRQVVGNGVDSTVHLFKSADAGATVTASELTLLATLVDTHATVTTDYLFGT